MHRRILSKTPVGAVKTVCAALDPPAETFDGAYLRELPTLT